MVDPLDAETVTPRGVPYLGLTREIGLDSLVDDLRFAPVRVHTITGQRRPPGAEQTVWEDFVAFGQECLCFL